MTDKQIIFKCDVDCIRKNTKECFELDCIKGQESILKQLKRKEQECEELKYLADHNGRVCNQRLDKIDELEHDNNELQGQLDQLKEELVISIQENEEGREINAELKAQLLDQEAETLKAGGIIHTLKQALRDIIEIAKPQTHYINIKQNKTASEVEYDYANIVWNLEQRMYKILQKCEVLDEI